MKEGYRTIHYKINLKIFERIIKLKEELSCNRHLKTVNQYKNGKLVLERNGVKCHNHMLEHKN